MGWGFWPLDKAGQQEEEEEQREVGQQDKEEEKKEKEEDKEGEEKRVGRQLAVEEADAPGAAEGEQKQLGETAPPALHQDSLCVRCRAERVCVCVCVCVSHAVRLQP